MIRCSALALLFPLFLLGFARATETQVYSTGGTIFGDSNFSYTTYSFLVYKDSGTNKLRGVLTLQGQTDSSTSTEHIIVKSDGDNYQVYIYSDSDFDGTVDSVGSVSLNCTSHSSNSGVVAGNVSYYASSYTEKYAYLFIYQKLNSCADSLDPHFYVDMAYQYSNDDDPGVQTGNNSDTVYCYADEYSVISLNKGVDTFSASGSPGTVYCFSGDGADSCTAGTSGGDFLFTPDTDSVTTGFDTVTSGSSEYWFTY